MSELIPHNREELEKLLETASGANSILEIGSRFGYVLRKLARVMGCKGRVVSVDLPGGPWGADSREILEGNIDSLKSAGWDAHLFIGDSRDREIIDKVKALGPFDFIFIDGDHSYEGAKADWQNYGPLGKIVVFHDISSEKAPIAVWKLWAEIQGNKEEFKAKYSKMGIGIWRAGAE